MMVLALLLALAGQVDPPTTADAAATAVARERFEAGRLHYDLGHFEAALRHFEEAYEARPLPGFLFNLGQCHFQLGHDDRAIFFYERYLEAQPDASNRDVVEELIAEARARRDRAPLGLPSPVPPVVGEAAPPPAPGPATALDDERAPWAMIAVGVGSAVVAAAVGVAVYAVVNNGGVPTTTLGTLDRSGP